MDVRSGVRATLLVFTFLWVVASLPHMYASARAFFLESLPAIVSAAMAPKCLFVFSNIIVAFLVGESKLSRRRAAPRNATAAGDVAAAAPTATDNGVLLPERKEEVMTAVTEALLLPTSFTGASAQQEQENNMLMAIHEDKGSSVFYQGCLMRKDHQCEEEVHHLYDDQHREVYEVQDEMEGEGGELILGDGLRREEEHQEPTAMQELQETDLPPADELNRRVEDFIARFNMERQMEAKMLVCCY